MACLEQRIKELMQRSLPQQILLLRDDQGDISEASRLVVPESPVLPEWLNVLG